jgi:hypothetical protein
MMCVVSAIYLIVGTLLCGHVHLRWLTEDRYQVDVDNVVQGSK